jgi:guanylate kinase
VSAVKERGNIFVISSPSGGGKSSLINRVLKRVPGLTLATSHTSRPPRAGEKDGVEYHFVTRKEFLAMRRESGFVEWVRLHGHLYGTSRRELDRLTAQGKDILLDIDIRGAASVASIYPRAVSVFILPPSLAVLEERLRKRGSESDDEIRTRLTTAVREMRAATRYRYCIVNRTLSRAAAELEAVITAERLHLSPGAAKALLGEILTPPA